MTPGGRRVSPSESPFAESRAEFSGTCRRSLSSTGVKRRIRNVTDLKPRPLYATSERSEGLASPA